jgi:hypothetical protein
MRGVVVFLGLLIAGQFIPGPAGALEQPRFHQTQAPDHNPLDCYCRAQGRMFAMGERVCLRTAEGPKLAQCRMEINVMSWSITEAPCPES